MTKQKASPLGRLHADSLRKAAYNKTPVPAKGYADNTPGTTRHPIIYKPEKENKR